MKRALWALAPLPVFALWLSRAEPAPLPPGPLGGANPAESAPPAEPAGVYGWLGLVDPATGRRWLPVNRAYDPPVVAGYPMAVHVVFRAADGSRETRVSFRAGDGLSAQREPRNAWWYAFPFEHDLAMEGDPAPVRSAGEIRIRYNPERWRFARVTMDEFQAPGRGPNQIQSGTQFFWGVPISPRAQPFPDLPGLAR